MQTEPTTPSAHWIRKTALHFFFHVQTEKESNSSLRESFKNVLWLMFQWEGRQPEANRKIIKKKINSSSTNEISDAVWQCDNSVDSFKLPAIYGLSSIWQITIFVDSANHCNLLNIVSISVFFVFCWGFLFQAYRITAAAHILDFNAIKQWYWFIYWKDNLIDLNSNARRTFDKDYGIS